MLLTNHTVSSNISLSLLRSFKLQSKTYLRPIITIMSKIFSWTLMVAYAFVLAMVSIASACKPNGTPVSTKANSFCRKNLHFTNLQLCQLPVHWKWIDRLLYGLLLSTGWPAWGQMRRSTKIINWIFENEHTQKKFAQWYRKSVWYFHFICIMCKILMHLLFTFCICAAQCMGCLLTSIGNRHRWIQHTHIQRIM